MHHWYLKWKNSLLCLQDPGTKIFLSREVQYVIIPLQAKILLSTSRSESGLMGCLFYLTFMKIYYVAFIYT